METTNESKAVRNTFTGSFEEVLYNIKKEREDFHFTQRCLEEKKPLQWEMSLVLRALARVSYLTKGQIDRFAAAWRTHFEPELKTRHLVFRMRERNLIRQMSKPVAFTRGELKGYEVTPFYLTRTGKIILKYLEDLMLPEYRTEVDGAIIHAETGEPTGEMFDRLKHDIMVSEVYVDLIERGNFVYWFSNENQLRRDAKRKGWTSSETHVKNLRTIHCPETVPDFSVCFYDKEKKCGGRFEGEVAVKYSREQILRKRDDLRWFCFNDSEAQKIFSLRGTVPTILTRRLYQEVTGDLKERRVRRSDVEYRNKVLEECFQKIGGLTIKTAAHFCSVSGQTVVPKLKKINGVCSIHLQSNNQSIVGRPRVLYFAERHTGQMERLKNLFLYNLAFEYLLEVGFSITIEDGKIKILDAEREFRYQLLIDRIRPEDDFSEELFEPVRRKIEEGEAIDYRTIIILDRSDNIFKYQLAIPFLKVVCLQERFHYL